MGKQPEIPDAPKHLSRTAKVFWRQFVADFALENHQLAVLQVGLEALDRYHAARAALNAQGTTYEDAKGNRRLRPEAKVELDNRAQFLRAMRQLSLPVGKDKKPTGAKR